LKRNLSDKLKRPRTVKNNSPAVWIKMRKECVAGNIDTT